MGHNVLMKLTFLLSKGQNLKSYSRSSEEECSVCNLSVRRRRLDKNIVRLDKKGFLNMYRVMFERNLLKI